jgi:hypothetical protein
MRARDFAVYLRENRDGSPWSVMDPKLLQEHFSEDERRQISGRALSVVKSFDLLPHLEQSGIQRSDSCLSAWNSLRLSLHIGPKRSGVKNFRI